MLCMDVMTGLVNGLALMKWKTNTQSDDDPFHWRAYEIKL